MTIVTHENKTGDKIKKDEKFIGMIKKHKEKTGNSWNVIAYNIYSKIEENSEYKQDYNLDKIIDNADNTEDNILRKFSDALKNAVKRRQTHTTFNRKKISLKTICELLGLRENEEELAHKEIYIQANTDILYEKIKFSEKFAEEDLEKVKNDANQGHKEAQTTLGHFYYYYGENKIRNVKEALKLYQLAAQQNDPLALYQLGLIYEYGDKDGEIESNENKSHQFYKQAAEQNFPLALNKMAYYYYGKQRWTFFFEYAKKAENLKDTIGTLYLAYAYQEGIGTNKNIDKAIKHYESLLNNKEALRYSMQIQWMIVKLNKTFDDSHHQDEAKRHYNELVEKWKEMMMEAWKEDNTDFFNLIFDINPNTYNNILAAAHYDYVHNPRKPTVFSALFGFDKNTNT